MSIGTAPPASAPLSTKSVVSYALGDVANNLAFLMTSSFFMIYMTELVGIEAGIAGAIYGVTKIWAGISDLTAGNTVDKTKSRWGRLRPWIIFGSFPLIASLVLLFSTPAGLSTGAAIIWILVFDALFQLAYSFVNIPYGSLASAMTQDSVQRSRLTSVRSIAGALTGVTLAMVLSPQFADTADTNIRTKFTLITAGLGLLAIVLYFVTFKNCHETVPKTGKRSAFSTTLKMVAKNRPLLTICFGALFMLSAQFVMASVAMYYAKYLLGHASVFIYLQTAQTVGMVTLASFVPKLTVRYGKRLGAVLTTSLGAVGYTMAGLVQVFFGPQTVSATLAGHHATAALVMAVVAWLFMGFGIGGTDSFMFSMQGDTVDYGEWKTGTRAEGGSYSILSFMRKTGQGVGGILGGIVVGAFGYDAIAEASRHATKTTPLPGISAEAMSTVQSGIATAAGWVPAGLALIAMAVFFFYPLAADEHRDLVNELVERRSYLEAIESVEELTEVSRPVITINGEYGAGASAVAEIVAEKLEVPYFGVKFDSWELQVAELATKEVADERGGYSSFLWDVAHSVTETDGDSVMADPMIVRLNIAEIHDAVADDGGVVVGRDAVMVLRDVTGVLHIRLIAPIDVRIARAAERYGISYVEAAERQLREDELRVEMSKKLMNYDQTDPEYYALVINTGLSTVEEAADQIVAEYRTQFPDVQ